MNWQINGHFILKTLHPWQGTQFIWGFVFRQDLAVTFVVVCSVEGAK